MLLDQPLNALELGPRESSATLQPNWVEPELRRHVIPLDVYMRRFVPIDE